MTLKEYIERKLEWYLLIYGEVHLTKDGVFTYPPCMVGHSILEGVEIIYE